MSNSAHNDTALPPIDVTNEDRARYESEFTRHNSSYNERRMGLQYFCRERQLRAALQALAEAEAKLAEVQKRRDYEVKRLMQQLKKCIDTKQRSLL